MKRNLKRFSDLDGYKIHKKDSDVHDWLVLGQDSRVIGHVNDLIVDMDIRKVAYLEISLADDFQRKNGRNILLPIEKADIEKDTEEIIVPMNEWEVELYPTYDGRIIAPAYLFKVQNHFDLMEQGALEKKFSDRNDEAIAGSDRNLSDGYPDSEELTDLKVKYLEMKKELKIAQAEKEIAILERDIAVAQLKREKSVSGPVEQRRQHKYEHR